MRLLSVCLKSVSDCITCEATVNVSMFEVSISLRQTINVLIKHHL